MTFEITAGDSVIIDSFNRWRISQPQTLFDGKLRHPASLARWDDQQVSGSGTSSSHSSTTSSTTISVSTTTAGSRVRQTFRRMNYQPGKSQLVLLSFCSEGLQSGVTRRIGYYDDDNGVFLEHLKDTGTYLVVKKNGAETKVKQDQWNVDTFEGYGDSNIEIDWTKAQIMLIDLEWLGVGRVRVGFVIDGIVYYAHYFEHANDVTEVYMTTPNLPLRYEITADGTNPSTGDLMCICGAVMSEGGNDPLGAPRGIFGSRSAVTTSSTYSIAGIRTQAAYYDAVLQLTNIAAIAGTKDDLFEAMLLLNPTLSGSPTWGAITNSAFEALTSVHTVSANGTVLATFPVFSRDNVIVAPETDFSPGVSISGVHDTLVLAARPITTSIDIHGAINWFEYC